VLEKLSLSFGLSLVAQASASLPEMPEMVGFGASASAFAVLVWMLVQERNDRERQRSEFMAEIREHRVAVVALQQALQALRSEIRRD
jgi:hypothetical protein